MVQFLGYIFGLADFIMRGQFRERQKTTWTGERGMGLRNDHEPELKLGSPEALLHNVSESYYFYWNVPMLNSILKALQ